MSTSTLRTLRRRRSLRAFSFLAILAAASLFLGCIRADLAIEVNDDGTGTASVLFAFDEEVLALLESFEEEESGTNTEFSAQSYVESIDRSKLPPNTRIEPYDEDDFIGARVTAPFERVEDLQALLIKLVDGVELPGDETSSEPPPTESDDLGDFKIERTADGWRFDAVMEPTSGADEAEGTEDSDFGDELFEDASLTIRIKLPGRTTDHNADRSDDGELTWNIDFTSTEPRTLRAVSTNEAASSGFPVAIAGGGIVALAAAGALGFTVMRRRSRSATAHESASIDAPPPPSVE